MKWLLPEPKLPFRYTALLTPEDTAFSMIPSASSKQRTS